MRLARIAQLPPALRSHFGASVEALLQDLEAEADAVFAALLPPPCTPAELQQIADPSFVHKDAQGRPHQLDGLARQLVTELSQELELSPLVCCDLLMSEALATDAATVPPAELKARARWTYERERAHLLLLVQDSLKLHELPDERNPARLVTSAFVYRLQQVDAGHAGESLTRRLLESASVLLAGLPAVPFAAANADPVVRRKSEELQSLCQSLFFAFRSRRRPSQETTAALFELLRVVAGRGEADVPPPPPRPRPPPPPAPPLPSLPPPSYRPALRTPALWSLHVSFVPNARGRAVEPSSEHPSPPVRARAPGVPAFRWAAVRATRPGMVAPRAGARPARSTRSRAPSLSLPLSLSLSLSLPPSLSLTSLSACHNRPVLFALPPPHPREGAGFAQKRDDPTPARAG